MSEITSGLHRGIYHQGKLRVNRYNPFEAYVGSESIGDEIIIYGRTNMNRAFDGDVVAVELLSRDQWHEEKSLTIADEGNFFYSHEYFITCELRRLVGIQHGDMCVCRCLCRVNGDKD